MDSKSLVNKVVIPTEESEIYITGINPHIFDGKVLSIDNFFHTQLLSVFSADKKRRSIYAMWYDGGAMGSHCYELNVKVTQDRTFSSVGSFSITFESDRNDIKTAPSGRYGNYSSFQTAKKLIIHFDYLCDIFDSIGTTISVDDIRKQNAKRKSNKNDRHSDDSFYFDSERTTFEALTDGTGLTYDEWRESGGDLDDLFTSRGLG